MPSKFVTISITTAMETSTKAAPPVNKPSTPIAMAMDMETPLFPLKLAPCPAIMLKMIKIATIAMPPAPPPPPNYAIA